MTLYIGFYLFHEFYVILQTCLTSKRLKGFTWIVLYKLMTTTTKCIYVFIHIIYIIQLFINYKDYNYKKNYKNNCKNKEKTSNLNFIPNKLEILDFGQ